MKKSKPKKRPAAKAKAPVVTHVLAAKPKPKILEVKAVLDRTIELDAHRDVPVEEKHGFVATLKKFFEID
jgi:hypothetical protein